LPASAQKIFFRLWAASSTPEYRQKLAQVAKTVLAERALHLSQREDLINGFIEAAINRPTT